MKAREDGGFPAPPKSSMKVQKYLYFLDYFIVYSLFVFYFVLRMSLDKELMRSIESLLDKKLNPIVRRLDDLKEKVDKIAEIEKSIAFLSSSYDDLFREVSNLKSDHDNLTQECADLRIQCFAMVNEVSQLKQNIHDMEQYSRRDCIEIRGIPTSEDEDTDEIVKNVGSLIDANVNDEDISISHRLKTNNSNKRDSPIIVKFIRRKDKELFYNSRKKLRGKSTRDIGFTRCKEQPIYITESLSAQNRKIFNKCLQKKRELKYKFIWTSNGSTLLRKDNDSPVIVIKNESDIDRKLP